jgi:serine protease inhibitor
VATTPDHLTFCLRLHAALSETGGNSCFSPYSVASALGLLSRASRGATADEVVSLLSGTEAGVERLAKLLRIASTLGEAYGRDEPVLAVSNTLWASDELPLEAGFRDELAGWPGGQVASAPFPTDPDAARGLINEDVSERTRGLIPELLPPGSVDTDTVATLVNALYLRTAWLHKFTDSATRPADFHSPGGVRSVPMMRQTASLGYLAHGGWQAVSMPAVGGVQAVVLLPDGDLAEQEPSLDAAVLAKLADDGKAREVRLSFPRFSLDVASPLTEVCKALGVRTVFTRAADLSGLTSEPEVLVSAILHQAVLKLDEQGLEGAAATAMTMRAMGMSIGPEPLDIVVDRPFLLLVRHVDTGVVYFFARVVEP